MEHLARLTSTVIRGKFKHRNRFMKKAPFQILCYDVAFSPNRKGDNQILTPKEENYVPRGEAARDIILLPAG